MIEPKYLVMVTKENNNKFYRMIPHGDTFTVEYGRIGMNNFQTMEYAISKWNTQYNSKLKKGYIDQTNLVKNNFETIKPEKSMYKEIANKSISDIVNRLQEMAKKAIETNYKVKSTAVTKEMCDEAQKILISLNNTNDNVEDFNNILIKLFSTIPRKMQHVQDYLANNKSDFSKIIKDEQDLLDIMQNQVDQNKVNNTPINNNNAEGQTILEALGLEFADCGNEDIETIKHMLGNDSYRYVNSWKVKNLETQNNFDEFIKKYDIHKTKLLWHGSRNENFMSIIKSGLKIRPSNAVYTGSMFSDGLYFSPLAKKSIGYCSLQNSYWAKGNSKVGFMAIFETAYGNPYTVYQHTQECYRLTFDYLQSKTPACHCLYASEKKGMLRNPEIVFYRTDQITIKYLVEIK